MWAFTSHIDLKYDPSSKKFIQDTFERGTSEHMQIQ